MADGRGSFSVPAHGSSVRFGLASEVNVQSAEIEAHESMRSVDSAGRSSHAVLQSYSRHCFLSIGAGHLVVCGRRVSENDRAGGKLEADFRK